MKVYGKNVFNELISNPKSIRKVYISKKFRDEEVFSKIKENKLKFEICDQSVIDGMTEGKTQGIVVITNDYEYKSLDEVLNDDFVVVLDHLEDPHNFGAIIRTCEAAGIKSIIIPKDRSVCVNETVMKTSSGALTYVNIVMVNNLNNAINTLKKNFFYVYGADMDGKIYNEVSYANKICLVIGSEGNGMSRLVKEACDEIVSIPMKGHVNSLNASVAAAVLIYGINRGK